jgi:hypothetical protein
MTEPAAGWLRADFKFRDFLNSNLRSDVENRTVFPRAYRALDHSVNSPSTEWETSEVPENSLSPRSFSRGWEGAFRGQEKPWL